MSISKARLKPISQLPEWALCCEFGLDQYEETRKTLSTVDIDTRVFIPQIATCRGCGAISKCKIVRVVGLPNETFLPVELLDIDEGTGT